MVSSFFISCSFSLHNLSDRRLDVYHTYFYTCCGLSASLECRSEMPCTRLAENTRRKKSPKIRHLHNLISVKPHRNTRSSYHVTLARPPTSSSLRITDRSFRYASPCLWNQLPNSLRQPHSSPSVSNFPADAPATSSYSLSLPLAPSITPSLFHSRPIAVKFGT